MGHTAASADLLWTAIDQAAGPIVIADLLGRITYANPAAARLAGISVDRILGRHFATLISGGHPAGDLDHIGARVAAGQSWSGPVVGRRLDGARWEIGLQVSPVRNAAGSITHSIALLRDLSAELETVDLLAGELRQEAAVGAALSGFDPTQPLGVLAADVASALLILDGVDSARLIGFGTGERGEVLADRARGHAMPLQLWVPPARSRQLRARAAEGAWVEAWVARRGYGRYGRELSAAGMRAVGFAPLRHGGRPVGVIAVGTLDPGGLRVLERHLTALSHFGVLASGLLGPALAAHQHDADLRAEIQRLIAERAFAPVFQPIVRLTDRQPIAYEALTRFSGGDPPERRFAEAEALGLGVDLEAATLRAAIASAQALPSGMRLSVNVSPGFILEDGAVAVLLGAVSRPIMLEITEREPIDDYAALRQAIAGLGGAVEWAVDDAGSGYASLRHIIELRPEWVKLDRELVSGINSDPIRQALVAGMLHFAASVGCQLIAEGVETEAERLTLLGLGIELGQGYLFGRPGPTDMWSSAS